MSTQTKRGLIKPDRDENYSIDVFNDNCDKIEEILDSSTIITIPADDPLDSSYTEETDSDSNTYYTIEINVTGMTSSYTGIRDMKPVYPRPYNVDGKAKADELNVYVTYKISLSNNSSALDGKIYGLNEQYSK